MNKQDRQDINKIIKEIIAFKEDNDYDIDAEECLLILSRVQDKLTKLTIEEDTSNKYIGGHPFTLL